MSLESSKNPRDVIVAPVVSEKSYACMDRGQYTFLVAPSANKTEIKNAIETIFDVKVASVNTANRKGKSRRPAVVAPPWQTSLRSPAASPRSPWFVPYPRLVAVTTTAA